MRRRASVAFVIALGVVVPLRGQEPIGSGEPVQLAEGLGPRAPEFFTVESGHRRVDARNAAILADRVSLNLSDAPLSDALAAIERQTGVRFAYAAGVGSAGARVTMRAEDITLAAALTEVLLDARVDVQIQPDGVLTLVRRIERPATPARQPGTGTIAGRVTDAALATPLSGVSVRIDSSAIGATVGTDGRYTIVGVAPGTYRVTARRVGYTALTKDVMVVAGQTAALNFALMAAPTRLDEIVTTAVGEQRRYQVGNSIATINADSITPTAPITSLTDLISARAPGVEVLETSGLTGSGEALRIRGQSSLVLQGDPIIVVDGVRENNSPGGSASSIFNNTAVPSPSRLNDIDFDDIASIDVLRGPSASTEYGTDAANGVIVITTKHSQGGPPKWTVSAEDGASDVGTSVPSTYYSWGHTTGANPQPTECPMVPNADVVGVGWTAGTCVLDSVTSWNPLQNSQYSVFGTGSRQKYDASVSGGSSTVRYYLSGGLSNETGYIHMPPGFVGEADSIGLPTSLYSPNTDDQRSVRTNTVFQIGAKADATVNVAYLATDQQSLFAQTLLKGPYATYAVNTPQYAYGYELDPTYGNTPPYQFGNTVGENTDRVTGGLTGNWRPTSWLVAHATVGVDHASQRAQSEILPQVVTLSPSVPAELGISNGTTDIYSVDLRATGTANLTAAIRSVTSVGLQSVDTRDQGTAVLAEGITSTNTTLNGAVGPLVTQFGGRQATLGGYVEEQLGLSDRLFVTGALRIDAGSGFGSDYNSAAYPKASVSWLAVNSGETSLRLRGAFGESGVQPPNGAALELYSPATVFTNGGAGTGIGLVNTANPLLQPERTAEFEGGGDLGLWHNRATLELTGYLKTTQNALVNTGTGWEAGNLAYYENIGEVRNDGVEAAVNVTVIQNRFATWDVTLNASVNHNDLVKLAPGLSPQFVYGDHAVMRFAPGTPLYGYAAEKEHWTDLNHDGIVEFNEVTVDDSLSYAGSSLPTREASFATHLGLWHGTVSVGALFDYRGGFRLMNTTEFHSATYVQSDLASNDPKAPIWEQLRDVATNVAYTEGLDGYAPSAGFYEDASYVRFRELSLTYALPVRYARTIGAHTLSLTGAIRNVALWTPYTGLDPEVTSSEGYDLQSETTSNTYIVNHDIREDAQAVPLPRYFIVRLNAVF